ncbi:ribose-5-phosphate isomerase RpiA [Marinicrinis lubricantis]|uniref:Ribose-5-phosphate isomerase A n=1 Tax=Marinicrinis lubricantis TaxID=2086470 RepID=A0ABW1IQG3_9BACL
MNAKKAAAEKAVEVVQDGMIVGLGTGSTSYWAIERIGERVREGLSIQAVSSSLASEEQAKKLGIPLIPLEQVKSIDIYIDGADEVDQGFQLIKGGGGALLREKILASSSKQFIVIVDDSKMVETLGRFPLPVEIVPFASHLTVEKLRQLDGQPEIRMKDGQIFISDNGNYIVDCHFGTIADPERMSAEINAIAGVVENGLFVHMASQIIVGHADASVKVIHCNPRQ